MTHTPTHTPARQSGAKSTHVKSSATGSATRKPQDAIAMLKADHAEVDQLFSDYEKARSPSSKKALIAEICTALRVHIQLEEDIFYPAITSVLKDKMLVPEAIVEHAGFKDLIAQLEGVEPAGDMVDAKVKVLSEYVKHHVEEEHTEMFPEAKASSIDMVALGAQMAERKDELMAQTT